MLTSLHAVADSQGAMVTSGYFSYSSVPAGAGARLPRFSGIGRDRVFARRRACCSGKGVPTMNLNVVPEGLTATSAA
ncbi:hypothetical protein, partial [Mycobacteroides abscessus]